MMANSPNKTNRCDVKEGLADPLPSSTLVVSTSSSHPSFFATHAPPAPAPAKAAAEQCFGPPPPTGMIKEVMSDAIGGGIAPAAAGGGNFEQFDDEDDDDNDAPAPFNLAEFEEGNAEKWAAASRARAQIKSVNVDDKSPPAPFDSVEFEEGNAVKWSAMASSLPTASSSQGYDSLLLADTPLAPTVAAERPSIADIMPLGGPSQEEFIDNNWINAMLVAVESALQNFE